jgi:hypothetical protein
MHTTNSKNIFILVADDCPVKKAEIPTKKNGEDTIATIQYSMIIDNPYKFTSDDIIFLTYVIRNDIDKSNEKSERGKFFSKGQPCLRSSPLTKRYGWGIHHNNDEKIAIYPLESDAYKNYKSDKSIKIVKAMRSKKA